VVVLLPHTGGTAALNPWRTLRTSVQVLLCIFCLAVSIVRAEEEPKAQPASTEPRLSTALRVFVREFRFDGNTVFTDAELARVTAPYANRELASTELEDARRAVTLHYVNKGFINSGAIIPDQGVKDGSVTFKIIEGRLSEIVVRGTNELFRTQWLRSEYVRGRLERWSGPPLNLFELREGLQLLRQDRNVKQINSELRPGTKPGESVLDVRLKEANPFRLGIQFDNHRPPSVGAEQITALAGDRNLTGHGDSVEVSYVIAHTTARIRNKTNAVPPKTVTTRDFDLADEDNFAGSYTLPLNRYDTTLTIFGSQSDYAILEEPFSALDINSETIKYGFGIRHPLFRSTRSEFALGFTAEREESQTFLAGVPFTVSPGAVKGETDLSILRFSQEWIGRSQEHVLALRSTFSVGIDALGITDDGSRRDGQFFAWLGQAQYVQRLFGTGNQLILRSNFQWSDGPLLSLEQFTLGGSDTVRGYRENQIVRDRGVLASAEFRVPILYDKSRREMAQLAPFADYGRGWNASGPSAKHNSIASVGIGLLVTPIKHVSGQIYWGQQLREIDTSDDDIQDLGVHFQVNIEAF